MIPYTSPDSLPSVYKLRSTGTCLEPKFFDGSMLVFDKNARCEAGDFVALWFRPEYRPGGLDGWVKRLVSSPEVAILGDPEAAIMVEMLNPRTIFLVRCSALAVIHKCLGEERQLQGMR